MRRLFLQSAAVCGLLVCVVAMAEDKPSLCIFENGSFVTILEDGSRVFVFGDTGFAILSADGSLQVANIGGSSLVVPRRMGLDAFQFGEGITAALSRDGSLEVREMDGSLSSFTEVSSIDIYDRRGLVSTTASDGTVGMYSGNGCWVAVLKDATSVSWSMTPQCPECDTDCIGKGHFATRSVNGSYFENGGGKLTISPDKPTACLRYHGGPELDKTIVTLRNSHSVPYLLSVKEAGQPVYERKVLPGDAIEQELASIGNNSYSFRVTVGTANAGALPAEAIFRIYRTLGKGQPLQMAAAISLEPPKE